MKIMNQLSRADMARISGGRKAISVSNCAKCCTRGAGCGSCAQRSSCPPLAYLVSCNTTVCDSSH